MTRPAYQFNSIIVRSPSRSVVNGLRAEDRGSPTYEGVKAEHDAYVEAMRDAGVKVTVLPALEAFPDSIFVEDPLWSSQRGGPASAGSGHARQGSRGNRADAA